MKPGVYTSTSSPEGFSLTFFSHIFLSISCSTCHDIVLGPYGWHAMSTQFRSIQNNFNTQGGGGGGGACRCCLRLGWNKACVILPDSYMVVMSV